MITVISKNGTEYTYSGVQYNELTASILDHHIAAGQLLVDVSFTVHSKNSETIVVPEFIYSGDTVEQAIVIQTINQTSQWKSEQAVETAIVTFDGKNYSSSVRDQQEVIFAIQTLVDKPVGETLTKRVTDGSTISLTLDKFKAIQVLISDTKEVIFAAEEHAYADAAGNITTV